MCLAIVVLAAARIAEKRWVARGGEAGTIADVAIVTVVAGVIGARVYHLFTGYKWSEDGVLGAFKIWEGGLSIWGAVAGGAIGLWIASRRRDLPALALADAIAPGVLIGQAIGRFGNWFNQELFGGPTKLPWGLEIDCNHLPDGYACPQDAGTLFHPMFLYEALYCLAGFGLLLWAERRFRFRPGQMVAAYVAFYTFGRFWFELMRTDPAPRIVGVRVNVFVSAILFVGGVVALMVLARRPAPVVVDGNANEADDRENETEAVESGSDA